MKAKIIITALLIAALTFSGCSENDAPAANADSAETSDTVSQTCDTDAKAADNTVSAEKDSFTDRDMRQTADTSGAEKLELKDNTTLDITKEGTYIISGTAADCTVRINVSNKEKVQLLLDGANITNSDFACVYVQSADKVFMTLSGDNALSVTGEFKNDGQTKVDAVIFSKDDLALNGTGTLTVQSSANGVTCKDDLKITGGSYDITSVKDGFEADKSISVSDGNFTVSSMNDGFSAKDNDDDSVGNIYIGGGTFSVTAQDNGIRGTTDIQIDGGDFNIKAEEGIESTVVRINGGNIYIEASDDGINASQKSKSAGEPVVEINGGDIKIVMGAGDTDGIDSNGSIYINGGTVDITGVSSFDYEKEGVLNGGTVYVNGEQVTELPNQMFGGGQGGFKGGFGGGFPGERPDRRNFEGDFPDGMPERGDRGGFKGDPPDKRPDRTEKGETAAAETSTNA